MEIKRRPIPLNIPEFENTHPLLQQIFAARGITHQEMLDKSLQSLLSFEALTDIEKAAQRLAKAIINQQKIIIIGDFDADGATSTALAVSALRTFGAQKVTFLVPNRFEYGYGLTPAIVDVASKLQPQLIVTVDNGITSIEGVARANALGIDVIVTDHHLPGDVLPEAFAIVNPNQHGCDFESKVIAGVGVIFYVMSALRRELANDGYFERLGLLLPTMTQFLDLVALGTVADVVSLDKNNRILVNQGLSRIKMGLCRVGIKALIEVSGRNISTLRESDLGFSIAPRLNAAGRLDDMGLGIACLLTENEAVGKDIAKQLDDLNIERRKIELEMKEQAMNSLKNLENTLSHQKLPPALCLYDPAWHQGVIGILAGRIKEHYHRPVIALAKVSEDELKGSARSISGLNIRDVLASIDKDHPGLMLKFGGHAMAAGLSLHPSHYQRFEQAFIHQVQSEIDESYLQEVLLSDGAISKEDLSLEVAKLIHDSGPWGQQFPEPIFDNVFEIIEQRLVGKNHLKMTLMHEHGGQMLDAIAFNIDTHQWPNERIKHIHAAYKMDINRYQGRSKLQLLLVSFAPIEV